MKLHISVSAEQIGTLFGLPVSNSLFVTWIVMGVLLVFAYISTRDIRLIPSTIQLIAEIIIEGLHNLFKSVVGEEKVDLFFPLLATIFLFILVSNWSGLLPGFGTIGFTKNAEETAAVKPAYASEQTLPENDVIIVQGEQATHSSSNTENEAQAAEHSEFVPLLRAPTADLNTTIALAVVGVFLLQYYGFKSLGIAYGKKYINFSSPVSFFIGILEIVSELSKVISFAFRLFGNIFAGEVLLTVIAFLMPLFAPLPFLGVELFVGVIQAVVFSMLMAVFLNMATISHEGH